MTDQDAYDDGVAEEDPDVSLDQDEVIDTEESRITPDPPQDDGQ